ncbi:MAG: iron-containing alcohol dehydrogenase [Deltaproteobacteria bacterium]|jgi:alcohol dehydrogenase class IV|nr:iron-containing alcohol dehydrogenase [Deltaproteobacteria bacterium]
MSSRFTIPRDIYFGPGSIERLKELKGKKAIVVSGGGSVRKSGALDRILGYLAEAKLETKLIEGIEPDPSVESVYKGAEIMREFEPDWIVAVGGGSPIDAAKAMWIFYENPDAKFEDILGPMTLPPLRKKAKLVGIGTTSGTATEVTACSVVTDYKTGIKHPLVDYQLNPDIAIVDPELTYSLPGAMIAYTGVDALTHAIEAYVAKAHSPFSEAPGLMAIEMIFANLERSYKGDLEARNNMHYAQCLAGISFTNAFVGIAHSMAHKIGAIFKVPHGCANAIFLPNVILYNSKDPASLIRFANLARFLRLPGSTDRILTDNLVEAIRDLNRKVGIPYTLKDFGVPEAEFATNLALITERSLADICTYFNPREIDQPTMERLFWCMYKGESCYF